MTKNGKEVIENIISHIKTEEIKKHVEIIEERPFGFDFKFYGIVFRIRVELLTNCEQTKIGHLAVYIVEKTEESEDLIPFNIWPKDATREDKHRMTITYVNDAQITTGSPNGSTAYRGFFSSEFPILVAEAALPINLDNKEKPQK